MSWPSALFPSRVRLKPALILVSALCSAAPAFTLKPTDMLDLLDGVATSRSVTVAATGSIEVGFSPKGSAEPLVLRVIDSAKKEIKVLAYSFTSAPVVAALLRAAKRGVAVSLVVDYKNNVPLDRSGKARAALSALAEAGCDVRVISVFPIHHDKVLIVDRQTIQTGSYNYSQAAAQVNSENVIVNWNNPELAKQYLGHFQRNWLRSEVYKKQY